MRLPIDRVFFLLLMSSFACGGQSTRSPTDHGSSGLGSASGNSSGATGAGSTYGGSDLATGASGNTSGNVTSPGVIAVLGTRCSPPGALACAGHAQKVTLVCGASVWTYASSCRSGENCDSRPGTNQGICLAIDPLCASKSPGNTVCADGTTMVECGPDLVSDSPAGKCVTQACIAGACTGVCSPGATMCMTDKEVATCNESGQWGAAVTCPNGCFVGASAGSGAAGAAMGTAGAHCGACVPNARQCMFGGSICGPNGEWPSSYNMYGCAGNPNGSAGNANGGGTGSPNDGG
ncbi:MAG TPA: hypothetical protein VGY54_16980 [Polyangiaceae bacterium]|nr:hypothetical protein [Polyangiaceae bacterium]